MASKTRAPISRRTFNQQSLVGPVFDNHIFRPTDVFLPQRGCWSSKYQQRQRQQLRCTRTTRTRTDRRHDGHHPGGCLAVLQHPPDHGCHWHLCRWTKHYQHSKQQQYKLLSQLPLAIALGGHRGIDLVVCNHPPQNQVSGRVCRAVGNDHLYRNEHCYSVPLGSTGSRRLESLLLRIRAPCSRGGRRWRCSYSYD